MKHIVKYMLHNRNIPDFIEDGGYYANGGEMIGLTADDEKSYIPTLSSEGGELIDYITRGDLKDYLDTLNLKDIEGNPINTTVESDRFFTERGL